MEETTTAPDRPLAETSADILRFPSTTRRPAPPDRAPEPSLREVLGDVLRDERRLQGRTLADVASDAAVSLPYLSEVERGRKEVSSDLLDAIGMALELPLIEILERAAERLRTNATSVEMTLRSGEFRMQRAPRLQLAA